MKQIEKLNTRIALSPPFEVEEVFRDLISELRSFDGRDLPSVLQEYTSSKHRVIVLVDAFTCAKPAGETVSHLRHLESEMR